MLKNLIHRDKITTMLRPRKGKGGPMGIQDYLYSQGKDGSFKSRKAMFDKYFNGQYSGTAEQNIQMLKVLQSERPSLGKVGTSALAKSDKASTGVMGSVGSRLSKINIEKPLESGIVEDKRLGKQYIIQNGKVQRVNNIVTGENIEGNVNDNSYSADMSFEQRATPRGYYKMSSDSNDILPEQKKEYKGLIRSTNPISAYGVPAPKAKDLAVHLVHNPKDRLSYFGSNTPYRSYGCTNQLECDIKDLIQRFPQGDTLKVVDSKRPEDKQYLNNYGIKDKGGLLGDDCPENMVKNPYTGECEPMDGSTQYFQTGFTRDAFGQNQSNPYNVNTSSFEEAQKAEQFATTNPMVHGEQKPKKKLDPYFALRGATTGLSWLSNRIERKRQDQYRYNQMSTLGQLDAIPVQNFQPNPFSLYAKYGGSIKKHKLTEAQYLTIRGLKDAHDKGDFDNISPNKAREILHNKELFNKPLTPEQYKLFGFLSEGNTKKYQKGGPSPWKAHKMLKDGTANGKPLTAKQKRYFGMIYGNSKKEDGGEMKKGGNWLKGAVNPEHKGYCTPITKPTCTGHRRAFAKMMKKKHGFHHD